MERNYHCFRLRKYFSNGAKNTSKFHIIRVLTIPFDYVNVPFQRGQEYVQFFHIRALIINKIDWIKSKAVYLKLNLGPVKSEHS